MPLKANTFLQGGKYRIIRYINSGGFGCTYEAEHTMLHNRIAIKEFFVKDFCNRNETTSQVSVATKNKKEIVEKLQKKFNEEAEAIWKFNHPNIVRVTDLFEENGTAYYVMDYINGKSLHTILKERGALPESVALQYIKQIGSALDYVHSHSRLHLDIKPGNIMIDENNNAVLIDFGASKQYNEQGENTSTLLGLNTVGYAPAEQMSRSFSEFNTAADVYALGATFYKLLTNITPPDSVLLLTGDAELPPLPPHISPNVVKAIKNAMKPQRKLRTQSIREFFNDLNEQIKAAPLSETTILINENGQQQVPATPAAASQPIKPKQPVQQQIQKPVQQQYTQQSTQQQGQRPYYQQPPKSSKSNIKLIIGIFAAIFGVILLGTIGLAAIGSDVNDDTYQEDPANLYDFNDSTETYDAEDEVAEEDLSEEEIVEIAIEEGDEETIRAYLQKKLDEGNEKDLGMEQDGFKFTSIILGEKYIELTAEVDESEMSMDDVQLAINVSAEEMKQGILSELGKEEGDELECKALKALNIGFRIKYIGDTTNETVYFTIPPKELIEAYEASLAGAAN